MLAHACNPTGAEQWRMSRNDRWPRPTLEVGVVGKFGAQPGQRQPEQGRSLLDVQFGANELLDFIQSVEWGTLS